MIEHENFNYKFDENKCSSCEGNCCIGTSGYIWITSQETEKLAKYLDISVEDCYSKYLVKYSYKFSIKEIKMSKDNYRCIFFDLDKKQCSIYEARPNQCRTFPFWEYFKKNEKEVFEECPAIVK